MTVGTKRFVIRRIVVRMIAILVMHIKLARMFGNEPTALAAIPHKCSMRVLATVAWITVTTTPPVASIAILALDFRWPTSRTKRCARIGVDLAKSMSPYAHYPLGHRKAPDKRPPRLLLPGL